MMKDPRSLYEKYTEQDMREARDAMLRQEAEKPKLNRKQRRALEKRKHNETDN